MKLCPECHSDSIEKTYSMALRVLGCIILIFVIPFGIFLAWIPFVLPYTYRCNMCGKEGKESELKEVDWRESELLLDEHKQMEEKIYPLLDRWFEGDRGQLYKVSKGMGQFLLVECGEVNIYGYRIIDFMDGEKPKLQVKNNLGRKLVALNLDKANSQSPYHADDSKKTNNPDDFRRLTPLGKLAVTQAEFDRFITGNLEEMKRWLEKNGKLIEPVEIEVI